MGYPQFDEVKTLTETATRDDWNAVSGTSLRGYVTATRDEIEAVFGKPTIDNNDPRDKVTTEWYLLFDDGLDTVATIYDWKRYEMGKPIYGERIEWNIGGHSETAVVRIAQFLNKNVKAFL
jgi:hypothetical protein